MFGYEDELQSEIKTMIEKIQHLIAFNQEARDEIWNMLNELSKLESKKMSKEDREAFICSKIELLKEYDLRGVFIYELETLL